MLDLPLGENVLSVFSWLQACNHMRVWLWVHLSVCVTHRWEKMEASVSTGQVLGSSFMHPGNKPLRKSAKPTKSPASSSTACMTYPRCRFVAPDTLIHWKTLVRTQELSKSINAMLK